MFFSTVSNSRPINGSPLIYAGDRVLTNKNGNFKFEQVSDTFYRGSDASAKEFPILAKKGIQKIINLKTISDGELKTLVADAQKCGIEYVNIPLNPYNLKKYLPALINELKDSKKTFVHCTFGIDRTGFATGIKRLMDGVSNNQVIAEMQEHGFKGFHEKVFFPMEKLLKRFTQQDVIKFLA